MTTVMRADELAADTEAARQVWAAVARGDVAITASHRSRIHVKSVTAIDDSSAYLVKLRSGTRFHVIPEHEFIITPLRDTPPELQDIVNALSVDDGEDLRTLYIAVTAERDALARQLDAVQCVVATWPADAPTREEAAEIVSKALKKKVGVYDFYTVQEFMRQRARHDARREIEAAIKEAGGGE